MPHSDTSPEAAAVQLALDRSMSPGRKLGHSMQASRVARELAFAGVRRVDPGWTEVEIKREFLRRQFPPDQVPPSLQ